MRSQESRYVCVVSNSQILIHVYQWVAHSHRYHWISLVVGRTTSECGSLHKTSSQRCIPGSHSYFSYIKYHTYIAHHYGHSLTGIFFKKLLPLPQVLGGRTAWTKNRINIFFILAVKHLLLRNYNSWIMFTLSSRKLNIHSDIYASS